VDDVEEAVKLLGSYRMGELETGIRTRMRTLVVNSSYGLFEEFILLLESNWCLIVHRHIYIQIINWSTQLPSRLECRRIGAADRQIYINSTFHSLDSIHPLGSHHD
jgi:hypothetical protein